MEIVLGIDNIIFISILADRLPKAQQPLARKLGLAMAMLTRILLLFSISWLLSLEATLFTVLDQGVTGKDLIMLAGGLFLLYKATTEIHAKLEGEAAKEAGQKPEEATLTGVIVQIGLLDLVFSVDSVITAVGMADDIQVMVLAVLVAVGVMMVLVDHIHQFIQRHPTVKMLALSFLMLIGVALVADGLQFHIPKGYIYFAMAFSGAVELLNMRLRVRRRRTTG
jgi:predicted tellurium resistance membrane protein TerC